MEIWQKKKLHIWSEKGWRSWFLSWAWNTEIILTDWGCWTGFCFLIYKTNDNNRTHLLESLRELSEMMYVSTLHWHDGRALKMLSIVISWKMYKTKRIIEEKLMFLIVLLRVSFLTIFFFFPKRFLRYLSRHALSKPVVCSWSCNQNFLLIFVLAAKRKRQVTFNDWLECGEQKNTG